MTIRDTMRPTPLGNLYRAVRDSDARDGIVLSSKAGRLLKADETRRGSAERHGFCSPLPFESKFDYGGWALKRPRLHRRIIP